jgi:multimeric flavodoxin WrbA
MKTIYVYYSLTGHVENHVKKLNGETYKIETKKKLPKSKFMQLVILGYKSSSNKKIEIKECEVDFEAYDKVVLCFPVWSGKVSNPMRSFLEENKFKNKEVDLIVSCGGSTGGAETKVLEYIDASNKIGDVKIIKEKAKK